MPRVLSVFNGRWFITGPHGIGDNCIQDKMTKKHICTEKKPKRGTKHGICMVSEDWHTYYAVLMLINGYQN